MKTLLLSSDDVAQIVQLVGIDQLMDDIMEGIATACREYDPERYSVPVRRGFSYESGHRGLLEWMPAIKYRDKVAIKAVGYHPDNVRNFGLPTVLSTAITFDTSNGHAAAIVDATFFTSVRTGAASAIASRILAAPDSRVLGLIGAGAQAVTQLHALSRVFDFETVLISDTDSRARDSFADRIASAGIACRTIGITSIDEIVASSDIICTATSIDVGGGPLFTDTNLPPTVHVNAVGSDFPGKTELPLAMLEKSLVCPDFREQAIREGECQQLDDDRIGPDLVTLVKNEEQFAHYRDSMTVFDSTGWALEDYVSIEILTRFAKEARCGTFVDLECLSDDPMNPYGFLKRRNSPFESVHENKRRRA